MNGQEIYLKQQEVLVDSLENRFAEFKREKEGLEQNIQDLNAEKEKLSIFVGNMFYEVVHNKLEGLNVAIIETGDHNFHDDINETLKLSGAFVPIHVRYMDKIYNVTEEQLQGINNSIGTSLEKSEDLVDFINNKIINSLVFQGMNDTLKFLADNEYIQYNYDFDELRDLNINSVIITGGGARDQEYKVEQLNVDLMGKLQERQFKVIGAEKLDVEQSHIPVFKNFNVSTVDNIDSRMGKISLVYLLKGAQGHYGEKSTADSLAPFIVINPSEE